MAVASLQLCNGSPFRTLSAIFFDCPEGAANYLKSFVATDATVADWPHRCWLKNKSSVNTEYGLSPDRAPSQTVAIFSTRFSLPGFEDENRSPKQGQVGASGSIAIWLAGDTGTVAAIPLIVKAAAFNLASS